MKAEEKIELICICLENLAREHGDYYLRRAWKRYSRAAMVKRVRAEIDTRWRLRSVWAPAFYIKPIDERGDEK